jgi:hypothetical protein
MKLRPRSKILLSWRSIEYEWYIGRYAGARFGENRRKCHGIRLKIVQIALFDSGYGSRQS